MKKCVNGSENSKGHKKKNILKNQAGRLFWPRSIHLYQKMPNPARETVPLKGNITRIFDVYLAPCGLQRAQVLITNYFRRKSSQMQLSLFSLE
jgi:hypothetical protein